MRLALAMLRTLDAGRRRGNTGEAVLQGSELHLGMMILAADGIGGNTFADKETNQRILAT